MTARSALEVLVWLVNTDDRRTGTDELTEPRVLLDYVDERRITGAVTGDQAELRAVRHLRARLREIFDLVDDGDPDAVVAAVNELIADTGPVPRLVEHDGEPLHLHFTPADAPLDRRLGAEIAIRVLAIVARDGGPDRLSGLRDSGLRAGPRRPLEEPLPALLRRAVRQPPARRRLPPPPGHRRLTTQASSASRDAGLERLVGLDLARLPQLVPAGAGSTGNTRKPAISAARVTAAPTSSAARMPSTNAVVGRVQQPAGRRDRRPATAGRARSTTPRRVVRVADHRVDRGRRPGSGR